MQFKYQFSEYIVSFHVVAKITFPDYALLHQTVQNPIIASTIKKSVHCVSYLQIGSKILGLELYLKTTSVGSHMFIDNIIS